MKLTKLNLGVLFFVFAVFAVGIIFYIQKNYPSADAVKSIEGSGSSGQILDLKKILDEVGKNEDAKIYTYLDQEINSAHLQILKNKLQSSEKVIVHFWASWCEPCVNEIPELIRYAQRLEKVSKEGRSDRTQIVVVNLDYTLEDLQKFLKSFPELKSDLFIQVWDRKNYLSKSFDVEKLPMTFTWEGQTQSPRKLSGVVDWASMP